MKDGKIAWKLPAMRPLRRVEEQQECNIFPPQVTLAAYRMKKKGSLPEKVLLPTTILEGKKVFQNLRFKKNDMPRITEPRFGEPAVEFRNVSVAFRSVKGEEKKVFQGLNLEIQKGRRLLSSAQTERKVYDDEADDRASEPAGGEVRLNGESLRKKKRKACPVRFPWSIRILRRCS